MGAFEKKLRVRFNEVDHAGIVFSPRFFDYFHMAFEDFFEAETDAPYHVWTAQRRLGWPAVHVETDFTAPLRYGDDFVVAMSFPKVGRTSMVVRYDVLRGEQRCARAEITVVTTQLDELRPLELPPGVRAAAERHPPADR